MLDNNSLTQKYNKLPEWLRWILFLPISFIFSIILWFFIDSAGRRVGAYEFVLAILHPVIVQAFFLMLIFYTVPKSKLKWVIAFIVLRALFLIFFVAQPILSLLGTEMIYDWIFSKN
ncbi:hypothetical protein KJ599_02540 [bacterium]|nr:hypothetical protein [bacterium]MBU4450667.1 hypothetical protein [Actinomycetota bacterium]